MSAESNRLTTDVRWGKKPLTSVFCESLMTNSPARSAVRFWKIVNNFTLLLLLFYKIGNYSRLACDIQFVRSMGYYLIQIYIPSSLIVVISWVSFWLNRNASPARVSLGVTTVLTMTTLMSSTNAQLPKISYVKSIDIYLGTCFVMVFASLLGTVHKPIRLLFFTSQTSSQSIGLRACCGVLFFSIPHSCS